MTNAYNAKLAKISYRLRAGRTDSEIISLGLLALFHLNPKVEMLVLICRAKLDDAQQAKLGLIARRRLASPADFFKAEIDAAIKAKVPDLFAHLSEKFHWSLEVADPVEVTIPEGLADELKGAFTKLRRTEAAETRKGHGTRRLGNSDIKIVRPPQPAAAALARIAGPEFPSNSLVALLPPAWVIDQSSTRERFAVQ